MIELAKQIGDLSKLVMVEEGYYFPDHYKSGTELIGDELADIFAAVIRIADYYDIDLEPANKPAISNYEKAGFVFEMSFHSKANKMDVYLMRQERSQR